MLNSVDLFTGIGGFTLALEGLCKPLLYCDRAPHVLDALGRMMRDGRLPKAEVVDDVRNLEAIVAAVRGEKVDVVTAGFPCVGFSGLGMREGLRNEESALFADTVKVVAKLKPTLVFFENVMNIISHESDIRAIVSAMQKHKYSCRWTLCSAAEVGAPQQRKRWFCLCVRNGARVPEVVVHSPSHYKSTLPPHIGPAPVSVSRYEMLGNAVVPPAARLAFYRLFSGFSIGALADVVKLDGKRIAYAKEVIGQPCKAPSSHCHALNAHNYVCVDFKPVHLPVGEIVLSPGHYKTDSAGRGRLHVRSEKISSPMSRKHWPTPRSSCPRYSNYLTQRSKKDLATFALFASSIDGVKQPRTHKGQTININFVEYMMGYPKDHTR
jgi:hypothetical protein